MSPLILHSTPMALRVGGSTQRLCGETPLRLDTGAEAAAAAAAAAALVASRAVAVPLGPTDPSLEVPPPPQPTRAALSSADRAQLRAEKCLMVITSPLLLRSPPR